MFVSIRGRKVGYDESGLLFDMRPVGEVRGFGRDFFAHSPSGASNSSGENPDNAMATVSQALAKATASRGDRVIALPGHNEVIGNETLAWAKAGVEIIGLGWGAMQPQFNFNHASALITLGANGMCVRGMRLSADVTVVAVGIDILATFDDCQVTDNRFDTVAAGTDEFVITIQNNAGCDRTVIARNKISNGIAGAAVGVKLTGANDGVVIRDNEITGDYSTANINGITTLASNLGIYNNLLANGIGGDLNSEPGIELLTGSHGWIEGNRVYCNLATKIAAIVSDTMLLHDNWYNEDIQQTTGLIGTASADD